MDLKKISHIFNFVFSILVNSGLKLVWSEFLSEVSNPNGTPGIHFHRQPCERAVASDSKESCETYLKRILTNPLSLKQQARMVIRNQLIKNIKSYKFVQKFVLSHPKYQLNTGLELSIPNALTTTPNNSQRITPTPTTHHTNSILECLIWQLDLPRCLHFYLYAFPDIPPMHNTIQNIAVS